MKYLERTSFLAVLSLLILGLPEIGLISSARAAVVYSQALLDPFAGYGSNDPPSDNSAQQIADDFTLGSPAEFNIVTWFGLYTDSFGMSHGGSSSQFGIRLFADDGTGLAPVNSTAFFSETVTVDGANTGVTTSGDLHAVFSYKAILSSVLSLSAGTY